MRTFLIRLIPRQREYPVEVVIGTGKVREAMGLHDRDDQGIAGEKFEPASSRPGIPLLLRGSGQWSRRLPDAELVVLHDAAEILKITGPLEDSRHALGPTEPRLDGNANRLMFLQRQRLGGLEHGVVECGHLRSAAARCPRWIGPSARSRAREQDP